MAQPCWPRVLTLRRLILKTYRSVLFVWELTGAYLLPLGLLFHHKDMQVTLNAMNRPFLTEKTQGLTLSSTSLVPWFIGLFPQLSFPPSLPPRQTEPSSTQPSSLNFACFSALLSGDLRLQPREPWPHRALPPPLGSLLSHSFY